MKEFKAREVYQLLENGRVVTRYQAIKPIRLANEPVRWVDVPGVQPEKTPAAAILQARESELN